MGDVEFACFEQPEQWELFKHERPETAADEIIRWAVGLFYSSANFDDDVFDRPFEFDIRRNPSPHLAFGGNGAHFCIGANLARMEIKLISNEIADQIPDIRKLSEPQRLRSGWINGVKDLQVSYG